MKPVVFLDRDGTLIEDPGYLKNPERVVLLFGVADGLRLMRFKGYGLVVVSNQSGVARGLISNDEFKQVHEKCCALLAKENVTIDEFKYCLHHPEDPCLCRKPKTGLISKTLNGEAIDFERSLVIGDKECDLLLGANLGIPAYLVMTGNGVQTQHELASSNRISNNRIAKNLLTFAEGLVSVG